MSGTQGRVPAAINIVSAVSSSSSMPGPITAMVFGPVKRPRPLKTSMFSLWRFPRSTSTPSGGQHLYWRWNAEGPEISNSAGRVGSGLDVRGEGGSIVAPPSVLADGRRYRWVRNDAHEFADAPAWLVKLALPPPPPPRSEPKPPPNDIERYVASAAASELDELATAREGTRNHQLNSAAFKLAQFVKAGALPEDWTRGQLEARAVEAGLPALEARRTIDSAFRAAQPRSLPR